MKISFNQIGKENMEKGFVFFGLFMFSEAVFHLLGEHYQIFELMEKALKLPVYSLTLIFVWKNLQTISRGIRKDLWVWALVFLTVLSVFWSDFKGTTLQKSMSLVLITLFGVYIGSRFDLEQLLRMLAKVMALIIALSIFFALVLPEFGVDHTQHAGAWQGVFVQKNPLGRMMVLSAIIFLFLFLSIKEMKRRTQARMGFFLSVLLLLLSTSKTALLVGCLLFLLFSVLYIVRRKPEWQLQIFMGLLLSLGGFFIWIMTDAETFFSLIGRDMTLTGRTDLWNAVIDMIQKEFWLGYGYYGFWQGMEGPSAYVWKKVHWEVPHSHNGFLDVWLDLGLIGLCIFVMGLLRNLVRAVQQFRRQNHILGLWPIMYIAYMIFSNITESAILNYNFSFFWAIYVATSVSMARRTDEIEQPSLLGNMDVTSSVSMTHQADEEVS